MKERPKYKETSPQYAAKYCHTVVKQVNVFEEAHDKQRKKSRTGLIKVSIPSNNISRQSYPSLSRIMFHKISHIYRDTVEKMCKHHY